MGEEKFLDQNLEEGGEVSVISKFEFQIYGEAYNCLHHSCNCPSP